jgi:hypothetical protein
MNGGRGFQIAEPPRASSGIAPQRRASFRPGLPAPSGKQAGARAPPWPADVMSRRPQRTAITFQKRCWAGGGARQPSQTRLHPSSTTEQRRHNAASLPVPGVDAGDDLGHARHHAVPAPDHVGDQAGPPRLV